MFSIYIFFSRFFFYFKITKHKNEEFVVFIKISFFEIKNIFVLVHLFFFVKRLVKLLEFDLIFFL